MRGAYWNADDLPSDVKQRTYLNVTEDNAMVSGMLYYRGDETTVVTLQHPREFILSHYLVPELLEGGVAVYTQAPRSVGNDIRLEHEIALYDVAAGLSALRRDGFEAIIMLGNSGGGSLYTFYLQQANAAAENRIAKTPAGRPTGLENADLPAADALVLVSPHPGQGTLALNALDPSVADEDDPLSIESDLCAFLPENGFQRPPQSSSYDEPFVARYRDAQRQRCERLDDKARGIVAKRMAARKRVKEGTAQPKDRVIAAHTPIFQVWRTDADLRCWDLSLDPSDRAYGSVWGGNPFASNWGNVGFARVCSAESWLSTWSGLSSNATMEKAAPAVSQPVMMVQYMGDNSVFPSDADQIFDWLGTDDKVHCKLPGDHHGGPVGDGGVAGREMVGEELRAWIGARFPATS